MRRFEREARAASALNHPNILTIYEIGQAGAVTFISTEFIDGETLRQRLSRGRLQLSELLDIAIQVVNALDAAHQSHIVHRDIKPENIMLRRDGYVKVLDFGLAKLEADSSLPAGPALETGAVLTQTGMVMGTVQYMSPEQALGQEVDHRTDLFSLGTILYEMGTGGPAFQAATPAAVFDEMLHQQPILPRKLNRSLPEELEKIIHKTLEKDRELRYQTSSDFRADLKRLQRERAAQPVQTVATDGRLSLISRWRIAAIAGALALILSGGVAWYNWRHLGARPELLQRQLTTNSSETPVAAAAISPDGKYLAFADENGMYLRLIDRGERHSLTVPAGLKVSHLAWFPEATWQETHLAERMGSACFSNRVSSSSGSAFSTGFSDGAPASIHLRMVSIWMSVMVSLKATGGIARVETFW